VHRNWTHCGSKQKSRGSQSRLEPQRCSVQAHWCALTSPQVMTLEPQCPQRCNVQAHWHLDTPTQANTRSLRTQMTHDPSNVTWLEGQQVFPWIMTQFPLIQYVHCTLTKSPQRMSNIQKKSFLFFFNICFSFFPLRLGVSLKITINSREKTLQQKCLWK
jgi:hypothetical protein